MITGIYDLGIDLLLYLQGLGDWLVEFMKFFTFLGSEEFFLLITPALYWCLDRRWGLRMGIFLTVSGAINSLLKFAFHSPRPAWYDPRVTMYVEESSFGIPSGHAQNAVAVWGSLAFAIRRRWAFWAAGLLAVLIGSSRLVTGAHFPHDVIAGWVFGLILLWTLAKNEQRALAWLRSFSFSGQLGVLFVVSLVFLLLGYLLKAVQAGWQMPPAWQANIDLMGSAEPVLPFSLAGLITTAATFFGLAAGAVWIERHGGFSTRGAIWKLVSRYLLGVVGVIVIWFGLGALFPRGEYLLAYSLRYVRYALVGLWVTGLAPWVFLRLHWMDANKPTNLQSS